MQAIISGAGIYDAPAGEWIAGATSSSGIDMSKGHADRDIMVQHWVNRRGRVHSKLLCPADREWSDDS